MSNYDVQHIHCDMIWSDPDFNCRGNINVLDVVDLAKDIEINTLQFPIAVQPANEVSKNMPTGYAYRIIAGHRRFTAVSRILKWLTVPAMIKTGLTEIQARLMNLGENLKRKDLDILQEARAIQKLKDLGLTQEAVANELGFTRSWVQVRFNLLDLPQPIQAEAASGFLNQAQIKALYGLKDDEARFEAVKKIKNARAKGERGVDVGKSPTEDPFKAKRHSKTGVQAMIDYLSKSIGFGLHTRVLAWANGVISTAELYEDIKAYAESAGIAYEVPLAGAGFICPEDAAPSETAEACSP